LRSPPALTEDDRRGVVGRLDEHADAERELYAQLDAVEYADVDGARDRDLECFNAARHNLLGLWPGALPVIGEEMRSSGR
jgi:hypothetical protein